MKQTQILLILVLSCMAFSAYGYHSKVHHKKHNLRKSLARTEVKFQVMEDGDVAKAQEKFMSHMPKNVEPATECKRADKYKKIEIRVGEDKRMNRDHFTKDGRKVIEIFSKLWGDDYKVEQDKVWKGFQAAEGAKSSNGISKEQLANGMSEFKWELKGTPIDIAGLEFDKYAQANKDALNLHELIYCALKYGESQDVVSICENCFYQNKQDISVFFSYLDCKKQGYITAETIWEVLNQMDITKDVKDFDTTAVNEFILVSDKSVHHGKLGRTDFVNGVLQGFYETITKKSPITGRRRRL